MVLRYILLNPPLWQAQARYALEVLFDGLGVGVEAVSDVTEADVVYAARRPYNLKPGALWMRADGVTDWESPGAWLHWVENVPVLYQQHQPQQLYSEQGDVVVDLLYTTYAILTGVLERHQPRNAWGVPIAEGNLLQQGGLWDVPSVSWYTNVLGQACTYRFGARWKPVPRWPGGKQYAVVLAHDVDDPFDGQTSHFIGRKLKRAVQQNAWKSGFRGVGEWTANLFSASLKAADGPYACFERWVALEKQVQAKSAFYVAAVSTADAEGAEGDVTYDFRHPDLTKLIQEAAKTGWEVGLLASVRARERAAWFQQERHELESVLRHYDVEGVRHRLGALRFDAPERTLHNQAVAGFVYDSSMHLEERAGFRRGIAWPFNPFDPNRSERVPVLQIAPTLIDNNLFAQGLAPEEAEEALRAHLELVFQNNGAAVLNFGLRRMRTTDPYREVISRVLLDLSDDPNIYWASPGELAAWWQNRRKQFVPKKPAYQRRAPIFARMKAFGIA